MKLRFKLVQESDEAYYVILARKFCTGKWEQIGTCHVSAKDSIKAGKLELIQFNVGEANL